MSVLPPGPIDHIGIAVRDLDPACATYQELLGAQQLAFNRDCVGSRLDVLLEGPGRDPGQLMGRSPYMQAVHVEADDTFMSEIVIAEITAATSNSLSGRRLPDAARAA